MRPLPRAQRERGCPRRLPGSPGRGLCLFGCLPAHRAEGPQPPHELGGGGGVRLRLGHAPGEHLLAAPEQALGTLPPVHPYLERDAAALGHQLRLVASPVSASSAQTVVDLRCTSIPKAVEYLGTGASQPRCGAAAPLALQQHCRSPDPRSRAGAPVVSVPLDWVIVSDLCSTSDVCALVKRLAVGKVSKNPTLVPFGLRCPWPTAVRHRSAWRRIIGGR